MSAITFTSWESCDWEGGYTLDWTSAAALRQRLRLPHLECLRQALFERDHYSTYVLNAAVETWPAALARSRVGTSDFLDANGDWGEVPALSNGKQIWSRRCMTPTVDRTLATYYADDGNWWIVEETDIEDDRSAPSPIPDYAWKKVGGADPDGTYSPVGGSVSDDVVIGATVTEPISSGMYKAVEVAEALVDRTQFICVAFADTTTQSGTDTWAGATSLGPWSPSTLLAAAGHSSWYTGGKYLSTSSWYKQMYDILRLMRWAYTNVGSWLDWSGSNSRYKWISKDGAAVTAAEWNTLSWTSGSYYADGYWSWSGKRASTTLYYAHRQEAEIQSGPYVLGIPSTIPFTIYGVTVAPKPFTIGTYNGSELGYSTANSHLVLAQKTAAVEDVVTYTRMSPATGLPPNAGANPYDGWMAASKSGYNPLRLTGDMNGLFTLKAA